MHTAVHTSTERTSRPTFCGCNHHEAARTLTLMGGKISTALFAGFLALKGARSVGAHTLRIVLDNLNKVGGMLFYTRHRGHWYRRYGICAHLTERIDVDVAYPDKLDNGMQHQYPERPLQANLGVFSPEIRDELYVQGKWLGYSLRRQVTSSLASRHVVFKPKLVLEPKLHCMRSIYKYYHMVRLAVPWVNRIQVMRQGPQNGALLYVHG